MDTKKPLQLSIIPSFYCNFNCRYCYLGDLKKDKTILDLNILKERLIELDYQYDIHHISIYGGEISLLSNEYLLQLIKLLEKYNISFVTNLSNIKFIDFCNQYNIPVSISLNEERDNYKNTLYNLQQLKTKYELAVVVLPSILDKNPKDLLDFYEKLGHDVFFIQYHPSINNSFKYNITTEEYVKFLYNILKCHTKDNYSFEITNKIILNDDKYVPTMNSFLFINPGGNYSSIIYNGDIEQNIEFNSLTEWEKHCKIEEKLYFEQCNLCKYYKKCKAEHLVDFKKPYCSGLYKIIESMEK